MNRNFDWRSYNAEAWDVYVKNGVEWTIPVTPEVIAAARRGEWSVILTATRAVPAEWFPSMQSCDVLCLAGGGGQQAPVFAAAGANVTVLDNSPAQLTQDRLVAEREGLAIQTIQGDMRDLSGFADASFDLVFHPISNCYVSEVQPIWEESFRVLRPGGRLLAGLVHPVQYLFDFKVWAEENRLIVKNKLPYTDIDHMAEDELQKYMQDKVAVEFSHFLEELIGGQIKAGFVITGFYEDRQPNDLLSEHIPVYFATRAEKLAS